MTAGVLDFKAIAKRQRQLDTWGNWKEPEVAKPAPPPHHDGLSLFYDAATDRMWFKHDPLMRVPPDEVRNAGQRMGYLRFRNGRTTGLVRIAAGWNWGRTPQPDDEIIGWRWE